MSSRLRPLTLEQAQTALEGFVTLTGADYVEAEELLALKRSQGLSAKLFVKGCRFRGDILGVIRVSFWVRS